MHLPLLPSHSLCCYGNLHEVDCIELALLSVGEAQSDRIMIVMNTSVCKAADVGSMRRTAAICSAEGYRWPPRVTCPEQVARLTSPTHRRTPNGR
ncbi:hypothetical protein KUCAC02_030282 [Chaenocephalus aceratus]|uniref:Uncharacterized protein n=1 Tax=Chaenocephalus aceratus TaxID=36190 RepID=A0ACB9XIG7_CHAAC|nr:hypothetical protein KUCAC02_030282 [Chaenocephalus aceratus]